MRTAYVVVLITSFAFAIGCGDDSITLHIEGEVLSNTQTPMWGARVELWEGWDDEPLAGMLTAADGEYSLEYTKQSDCREQGFNLVAKKTGYKTANANKLCFDFGTCDTYVKCTNRVQRIDFVLDPH